MVLGVKGTYDGFDRVSKTTNGKTTESILDNGSVSADLIGETLKVFSEDNSVFCQNGMFSYNVINTKGDIIASDGSNDIDYNYNAYGTELYKYSSANPIGYRNYYYDSETGLYYLKARYYDPTTGQFTQEDTVQDDNLQYNLYGYCSANPVLYTDPSGHCYKRGTKIYHDNWSMYSVGKQNVTSKGISFIKRCETFKSYRYKALSTEKYYTIGYGHYDTNNKYKNYVKGKKKMTEKEATVLLKSDLKFHEQNLNTFCKNNRVRLNDRQFDACIADSFQKGQNIWFNPKTYSLPRFLLNTSDKCFFNKSLFTYKSVKTAFITPTGSTGGLHKRRIAEANLFYNDKYSTNIYG